MNIKVTSVSSKGQVVIPTDIRERLKLAAGSHLVVLTDGSNVLLKPISAPKLKSFAQLIKESRKFATDTKLTKRTVARIITTVRNENRS